jgi:NAD+ synthase
MPISEQVVNEIATWIREQTDQAGCAGVVLGVSGGIDSAVTAGLAQRALGGNAVLGLIMPCRSNPQDEEHARLVIETFGIESDRIDLAPAFDTLMGLLPPGGVLAVANAKPRLRMLTLYYYSNLRDYLVIGTSNRTELSVGYFTKYGDGGSDFLPLGDLFKCEVYDLGMVLGVPDVILQKAPSGGLWQGQTDEGEMGITYETLDRVLEALEAGDTSALEPGDVVIVEKMVAASEHKRVPLPIFRLQR